MPGPPLDPCPAVGSGIGDVWSRAAIALGARSDSAVRDATDLTSRYAQQHRRYHHGAHVAAVLRDSAWLADELGLTPQERHVLALAVCAHDVVYDARPGIDERASAEWAGSVASGVAPRTAARVAELVLATFAHATDPDDPVADALLDADLAILAAPQVEYARYVEAVRAEYAAVPEYQWRQGRAAVLTALLARPELYRSTPARERWDVDARVNVRAELASLESR